MLAVKAVLDSLQQLGCGFLSLAVEDAQKRFSFVENIKTAEFFKALEEAGLDRDFHRLSKATGLISIRIGKIDCAYAIPRDIARISRSTEKG